MAESTSKQNTLRWRNLKTGLLFIVGLGVAAWLGFYIGKNTGLLTKHRYAKIFVPDIKGLTEGNLVAISGKKVGVVKTMEFTSQHDTNGIMMTLDIRDEFFSLIVKDTKATIKSLGVLGDKYVDLSLGNSKEPLPDGGQLSLSVDPGLDELTASAIKTMKNVSELTDKINAGQGTLGQLMTSDEMAKTIYKTVDNLNVTLASVNDMTGKMTHGNGTVSKLLTDGAMADDIAKMVGDFKGLSAKLKEGDGAVGKLVLGDQFLQNLKGLAGRTDSVLNQTNLVLRHFGGGGGPNGGSDEDFYSNLNKSIISSNRAIRSLDSLLSDMKANPSRYVHFSVF